MNDQILMVKRHNQDENRTMLSVEVTCIDSFCKHLKENKVEFKRSPVAITEWGWDKNKEKWEFRAYEVSATYIQNLTHLISTWHIPNAKEVGEFEQIFARGRGGEPKSKTIGRAVARQKSRRASGA